jgi:flagellin
MLHKENVTASKGRMIDLDVAAESSKLVKSQILQKAATSMLAQANNMPASALDLLP